MSGEVKVLSVPWQHINCVVNQKWERSTQKVMQSQDILQRVLCVTALGSLAGDQSQFWILQTPPACYSTYGSMPLCAIIKKEKLLNILKNGHILMPCISWLYVTVSMQYNSLLASRTYLVRQPALWTVKIYLQQKFNDINK